MGQLEHSSGTVELPRSQLRTRVILIARMDVERGPSADDFSLTSRMAYYICSHIISVDKQTDRGVTRIGLWMNIVGGDYYYLNYIEDSLVDFVVIFVNQTSRE